MRGDGFVVVPSRAQDLDDLCRLLWDREVRRYLCDDIELPRDQIADMLARSDALTPRGLGLWTIRSPADDMLGCVGAKPVDPAVKTDPLVAGEIEPTIALSPAAWGKGLATEVLRMVIDHAFNRLGLNRLVAIVDEPNTASRRLMARVGFRETGSGDGPKYRLIFHRLDAPLREA
ncbi:MAG TPA: GNAT family N-acetyltransferase [Vineibacter sp.]|nr:GNAT family N-acetyltransferase [Vineibacter sp.]